MELEGIVHHGVVVLDESAAIPEGTRVRIEPLNNQLCAGATRVASSSVDLSEVDQTKTLGATLIEQLRPYMVDAPDLPSDLALQHDHYLYGTPKR